MGIMETLGNVTEKMNNIADSVTGANNNYEQTKNRGLEELGNINHDNANGCIEIDSSSRGIEDKRKLDVVMEHFGDSKIYTAYLKDWLINTGEFSDIKVDESNNCIIASTTSEVKNEQLQKHYYIHGCTSLDELDNLLNSIKTLPMQNRVIFGYINASGEQSNTARQYTTQIVGTQGIIEINNAIDLADKKFPYIAFNKGLFYYWMADRLYKKYKGEKSTNITEPLVTNQGEANQLGNITIDNSNTKISLEKDIQKG